MACLQAAWASFSILCPQDLSILRSSANIYKHFDQTKTLRLGLSSGCAVTPFPQSSSPSVPTIICSVLLVCRQQGVTAGVERIREGVKRAIPGFNDLQLASVVHRTLRSLIKVILGSETGFLIILPRLEGFTTLAEATSL